MKNGTEVTLKLWSYVVGDSNYESNFLHKLLSINTQVSRFCKVFANNSSANIKSLKTQLYRRGQTGEFLGRLLGPLLKVETSLMKNLIKPSAKIVLITIVLTAALATRAAIHKKSFESATRTLLILNEEMYVNGNNVIYLDSFRVEHIPKEIKKIIEKENIITRIISNHMIQNTSILIMCVYFCIGFIGFMLRQNSLLYYANLFSPNGYEMNDEIILKFFQ